MKKFSLSLIAAFFLMTAFPAYMTADEKANDAEISEANAELVLEVKKRVDRLGEIKAMEFSELTSAEKKELRKEVRSIHKELKAYSKADAEARANSEATAQGSQTGIYISGSAIIIILLLILLL